MPFGSTSRNGIGPKRKGSCKDENMAVHNAEASINRLEIGIARMQAKLAQKKKDNGSTV